MKVLICGTCNYPADAHSYYERDEFVCDRQPEDIKANGTDLYFGGQTNETKVVTRPVGIGVHLKARRRSAKSVNDFYVDNILMSNPTWDEDYSGPEAWSGSDLAQNRIASDRDVIGIGADDHDDPNNNPSLREFDKIDRWNDTARGTDKDGEYWISTHIVSNWKIDASGKRTDFLYSDKTLEGSNEVALYKDLNGYGQKCFAHKPLGRVSTESVDKTRNVFLDNQDGFTSVELLNLELTEKYQRRLLNVFADKNGRVRIGSIVISDNADGTKTATCVRDDCRLSTTSKRDPSRKDMEDFIWAIVAHGNNHAAYWFTSRPTFHKVHRLNCDHAKCNESVHYCAYIKPDPEPTNKVVEHYRNCKTPGCDCANLLMVS